MIRRFNRFELKYLVPIATWEGMIREISAQMSPDPMGKEGVYPVTSLYYDTPDRQFYRSKLDGVKYRRKLRIRMYGEPSEANPRVMVEIKQRINRTTQKRRVRARLEEAYALCEGEAPNLASADEEDRAVASEVEFLSRTLKLERSCTVGYLRRAFVGGPFETGLRLTFDHVLWVARPTGLTEPCARHSILRPEIAVVEVKANDAVPLWVSRMLARHRCTLQRFSKYCAGWEALNG
jgi:hypothetical protein